MIDFNKRTATDMERDYESGISNIDKRIIKLEKERKKLKPNTVPWIEMNQRIYALEVMQGDMAHQLWMLRKYAK